MPFQFIPVTGLNDASQFPAKDPLIRQHLQSLLQQIPTYYDAQFVNNLVGNGYQKLANGLIIQWGTTPLTNGSTVYFPIAFPNAALNVNISSKSNGNNYACSNYWGNSSFIGYVNTTHDIAFIAIGY